jgi:hypothetical protein
MESKGKVGPMLTRVIAVVAVVCSACAGTQPTVKVQTRAERVWAQQDREERLYELAKQHPNAVPRERPAYPEFAPGRPKRSAKPWL